MYLLGPEGCRSYIQQSASETDWYTLSNSRLYMPASRYIISTYDWVCTDVFTIFLNIVIIQLLMIYNIHLTLLTLSADVDKSQHKGRVLKSTKVDIQGSSDMCR